MPATYPQFIPQPFANNASGTYRNNIPDTTGVQQRASFNLGFPPITMTPVPSGGKPMLGPDLNGVLFMMSTHTVYQQSGMLYRYSASVVTAIGGYAVGTLLGSADGSTIWYNTVAANTTDPDAGGAGWLALYSYGITTITGLTGGITTLTAAQASKSVIVLLGALISNQQIVLPNQYKRWLIVNGTTGAFTLTVKTASGTGVVVGQGGYNAPVEVWGDTTNIYNVVAPVNLPIDQNPTPNTIAQRTNTGYLLATYFNQNSPLENFAMGEIYAGAGDGFLRKISPTNFAAQLLLSMFSGQVTNAQVPVSAIMQYITTILANAALTGTPTAPTPTATDNSTKIATTAFVQGFGIGGSAQSYHNVTGLRAEGTNYTNSTGRPIFVIVSTSMGFPAQLTSYVDGAPVSQWGTSNNNEGFVTSFIVPAGSVYKIQHTGGSFFNLTSWYELS
jgi:hypothetical protein